MVTNRNFLAVLLLRHWALAGHLRGRGCVRSWAVLALKDPTPTPWAPLPKGLWALQGGQSPRKGGQRGPLGCNHPLSAAPAGLRGHVRAPAVQPGSGTGR